MNYKGLWNIYNTAIGVWMLFPPWFWGCKKASIIFGIILIVVATFDNVRSYDPIKEKWHHCKHCGIQSRES